MQQLVHYRHMLASGVAMRHARAMSGEPAVRVIGTSVACTILGVDRSTVIRWVQSGALQPVQKLGPGTGAYLFDREAVEALLAERAS